jgi:hypothetical protein
MIARVMESVKGAAKTLHYLPFTKGDVNTPKNNRARNGFPSRSGMTRGRALQKTDKKI